MMIDEQIEKKREKESWMFGKGLPEMLVTARGNIIRMLGLK